MSTYNALCALIWSPCAFLEVLSGIDVIVMWKDTPRGIVILVIYIVMTFHDQGSIFATKGYLQDYFVAQDLGTHYFFGIEFSHQSGKLDLSQRKYALNML